MGFMFQSVTSLLKPMLLPNNGDCITPILSKLVTRARRPVGYESLYFAPLQWNVRVRFPQ